jgi:dolichyl-phosphate-mannose-protein mannosyltransferase
MPGFPPGVVARYARDAPWGAVDWLLLLAVTIVGAALRFPRLASPDSYVFDETYYARDACLYLAKGMAFCRSTSPTEISYVQPPLGKWIIAVGEWLYGYNSYGWRIMAAIFGTALIVVVFLLARKLLGRWAAAITGLLVATDFLLIVESRIAMLDIFLAFFVVLGFFFVVCDHQRVLRLREAGKAKLDIRWRLAAGFAFGCAGATKWSGFYAAAGAGILLLIWTIGTAIKLREADHAAGRPPGAPSPVTELNATLLSVGIPVILVYLASYAAWFKDNHFSVPAFYRLQNAMVEFNIHLHATHPFASRPWTWPLVKIPVAYFFRGSAVVVNTAHCTAPACKYAYIVALGNPATWWAALPAFLYVAFRAFQRRHGPERIIVVAWLFGYLPWFLASRTSFFYYMTPVVPFMMLGLAITLRDLAGGSRLRTAGVVAYLLVACGGLVWFWYPVITAVAIPQTWWQERMLFNSWICGNCKS